MGSDSSPSLKTRFKPSYRDAEVSGVIHNLSRFILVTLFSFLLDNKQQQQQVQAIQLFQKPRQIMGQAISTTQFFIYGKRHFTA